MVDKIDSNIPVAIQTRPIERANVPEAKPSPTVKHAPVVAAATYDFQFRVNPETDEITATIVDPQTRVVIREIPAKEMQAASDVIRRLIGPRVDRVV
ncbi:MAG: flagellar protein FlaG [Nitrospirota bacterium]|nr:flagellar protein FlaG [Nitrospirota bacterium]MDP2383784.1 flagellar protein FlaG [Nitrospirota bacterium]MDP3596387.1 flagellar protein FlaG [Nitrospirota bacterium]